jgi:hypothetical protein
MIDRIIIDVAPDEFDFIKEAIAQKTRSLLLYMDTCQEQALKEKYKNDPRFPNFSQVKTRKARK